MSEPVLERCSKSHPTHGDCELRENHVGDDQPHTARGHTWLLRPDYVRCAYLGFVKSNPRGHTTWCGRDARHEWTFGNASHALLNGFNGGYPVLCHACAAAMRRVLDIQDDNNRPDPDAPPPDVAPRALGDRADRTVASLFMAQLDAADAEIVRLTHEAVGKNAPRPTATVVDLGRRLRTDLVAAQTRVAELEAVVAIADNLHDSYTRLTVAQATAYLRAHGWHLLVTDACRDLWTTTAPDGTPRVFPRAAIPTHLAWKDGEGPWTAFVAAVAYAEGRSPLRVLVDLLATSAEATS